MVPNTLNPGQTVAINLVDSTGGIVGTVTVRGVNGRRLAAAPGAERGVATATSDMSRSLQKTIQVREENTQTTLSETDPFGIENSISWRGVSVSLR